MPEITEQYIRIPVAQRRSDDEIRTISISAKKGVKALYARNRRVIITYLFSRKYKWDMNNARKWVAEHHDKSIKKIYRGGQIVKQYGPDIDLYLTPFEDIDGLIALMEQALIEAKLAGWNEGHREVGRSLRPLPDKLVNDVMREALSLSNLITNQIKDNVAEVIINGFNSGQSAYEIATEISKMIDKPFKIDVEPIFNANGSVKRVGYTREMSTKQWSEIVARTETNKVATSSILDVFNNSGFKRVKWFANPDACELCKPLDGKVYDNDSVKGLIPFHPNCRCTWLPVIQKQINANLYKGIINKGREVYDE